ncbi:hypothetical protein B4Q04_04670 [Zobellia sp. OII3]|uniref:CAP domain-containing protein n=1 Tax=Zobellia sp. OII3 TaxID=2034520 RepID=UPI000B536F63|nr:CAP domain-containing protein [Zobellia sp. OII3]OWW26974.1 hypothetical protein B4Q04_04670 [Zobellia sp. OII3]
MHLLRQILPAVCCMTLFFSCSKDSDTIEDETLTSQLDPTERAAAKKLYEDYYVASKNEASDVAWSGDEPSCNAGSVPENIRTKLIMRIHYFRKAVGLNNTITENPSKSEKSQQAALMMHANGTLDHSPPESWKCFTAEGKEGAGNSLLTSTKNSVAIDSYMRDQGSDNYPVGHRRWLLWPRLQEIGIGNTSQYNALWVLGNPGTTPEDAPEFVAWPPKGYLPKNLAYQRWSFSIPKADFTQTSIKMKTLSGTNVSLEIEELDDAYGDRTIVWRPDINVYDTVEDVTYKVIIESVLIDDTPQDYEYEVTLFDPDN